MPKLTTKITVKLEPEFLQDLQSISESEGMTISRLVREAVYDYVSERRDEESPGTIRLSLSRFEMAVVNDLIRIGYVDDAQQLFHEALHDQLSTHNLGKALEMASRIRDMSPYSRFIPQGQASPSSISKTKNGQRVPEADDEEERE